MPNINTLNNVIAVVVVILTLSLIVQSIQALMKEIVAIKSQQSEDSLVDLFENVVGTATVRDGFLRSSPVLRRMLFRGPLKDRASSTAKPLLDAVLAQFRALGRVTQHGAWMLDSLCKDDLMKVLARVGPDTLIRGFTGKVQTVCTKVKEVEDAVAAVQTADLPAEAGAAYARFQESLAPLLNDYRTITTGGQVNAGVLIGDLVSFGQQPGLVSQPKPRLSTFAAGSGRDERCFSRS